MLKAKRHQIMIITNQIKSHPLLHKSTMQQSLPISQHPTNLNVLPSRNIPVIWQRNSRETQTISDIPRRNGGIAQSGKHLPALVRGRTGHETSCTPAVEGVVVPGSPGLVGQVTDGGTGGDGGGVGLGEAQSAGGVNVDLLAAGDFDVLHK